VATRLRLPALACTALIVLAGAAPAAAKKGGGLLPLSAAPIPAQPDVQRFVADANAAARLGKALFWDMQAGSDGRTACASCHYDAGADSRSRNQVNPHGTTAFAANEQLTAADFPLTSDRVVGSQGVLPSAFEGTADGDPFDLQRFAGTDADFHVGGTNVRRVTGRNAPSAVNAIFNFRSFWDGRAQNDFNGVSPFGAHDADARVGQVNASGGVDKVAVSIANSSLASQSVGPPGNAVEMSADGRTLSDIGKKLLTLHPLGTQQVSRSDSLLGSLAAPGGRGLDASYADLIREAFQPEWWNASGSVAAPNGRSYSLMQFNFPLFWGLAIQAYESRLVSDGTPFDRLLAGDQSALDAQALEGMGIFAGKGDCLECHTGAALTDATGTGPSDEGTGGETGFHNIGVRSPGADPGLANATFKTPGLRNVELTAPYFHNGGKSTLRQVVDFYSIGGDFPAELKSLSLTDREKDALVAFLKSLTDPRVRDQAAPFDHPQLLVAAGAQTGGNGLVLKDAAGRALDCFKEVPVTGAAGGRALPRFLEFTGPPCFAPPPPAAAPAKATGPAVSITVPSVSPLTSRSCKSRRNFTVQVYRPRGDRIKRVTVLVNGRRVADLRNGRTRRARVDLRGLPRGVMRVKIVARTAKGREIVTLRKYRTCSR
jgi:cytochrome c peroxidase